ncbi:DUF6350 family protein [Microbacterium sp. AZCO]|uniref:cell division protein PerM n=1 Tax=Microbacterium sp. AZCO TaxID=3142976 RepID=UPI0031F38EBB
MHRLIVAFLAAFDAAIAVAAGIAATLAPLTLVWVFGLGDGADWGALWPASAVVWQLGHLVPVDLTLPGDYLAATGISESAASFTLSLAPLAYAAFTAIFAARSGARASRADAWLTGVLMGAGVVAVLSALIVLTSHNTLATTSLWQGILFPTVLFAGPALAGAVVTEWREASEGVVARVRDRVEAGGEWGAVPGIAARGSAAAVAGLVGAGALAVAVAVAVRAGQIVALYQAGNLDLLGVVVVTLAQLAYLPTLVVWGVSFIAGPGFSLGTGTAVSPSGTQLGVVPGVPVLGMIPESTSTWLLLVVLLPIAVGAFAGWIARSHLLLAAGIAPRPRGRVKKIRDAASAPVRDAAPAAPAAPTVSLDDVTDASRKAALEALLAAGGSPRPASATPPVTTVVEPSRQPEPEPRREAAPHIVEPFAPRLVVAAVIAVVSAGAAALLSLFASGSLGPDRLAHVGPEPGPVALAVGVEVLVGASILLLVSRRDEDRDAGARAVPGAASTAPSLPAVAPVAPHDVAPVDAPPVRPEAPPVLPEAPPVRSEAPPVLPEAPPVRSEAPPVRSEAPPVRPVEAAEPARPAEAPEPARPADPVPSADAPVDHDAETAPIDLPTLPIDPPDAPDTAAGRPSVD